MVCTVGLLIAVWIVLLVAAAVTVLYMARADSYGRLPWDRDAQAGAGSRGRRVSSSSGSVDEDDDGDDGRGSGAVGGRRQHRPRVVSTAVAIAPAGKARPGSTARRVVVHGTGRTKLTAVEQGEPDTLVLPLVSKTSSKVVEIKAMGPLSAALNAELERRASAVEEFPSRENRLG